MVVGDIGSGKSSLLYAILNEMIHDEENNIEIYGSLAFCPQKPWIASGTVKDNIVFNNSFDEHRLKEVIYYAALEEDMKSLPKGI